MHIFTALTYYRPHYSGLTIYAERLAQALVRRGHRVTVLTSRFDQSLSPYEFCSGVEVIRPDVALHVSKGVLMPAMPLWAWRLARQADVVHLHLPQLDAAPISILARLLGKPVVLTYHCDLSLPKGFVHFLANQASHLANHISARSAQSIVTNTRDYAESSEFLRRYLYKVQAILPPVELAAASEADLQAFRQKIQVQPGQRLIGMLARLATEKGVEYLVEALPQVLEKHPQARVIYAGQHENLLGEEQYAEKLKPRIERLGSHWQFLGILSPQEAAAFYKEVEVTVLPSINSTESFGMVQVEAMSCGTPVVASDLPGVRVPIQLTGMGKVVPARSSDALAQALIEVLDQPARFSGNGADISRRFAPETIAMEYEHLFMTLAKNLPQRAVGNER